ncbi:hypothetical protein [Streptomyces sp. DH12]|uniref:hypothetical protein n=1 Tax=Streptomyces sp. DH12 TaxID=2857010 RepID=UPI001E43F913|nr:hypothetical protein [Streptomyces sp. DH12]
MTGRPLYCSCEAVQNYDYAQAAEKLRCKERFLRDRIKELPHQRMGESVSFCDCELRLIQTHFTFVPAWVDALCNKTNDEPTGSTIPAAQPLAAIRPARGRRTRIAS